MPRENELCGPHRDGIDVASVPAVWPARIFFCVPLDGTELLFSVVVFAGCPDGLARRTGAPVDIALPRR